MMERKCISLIGKVVDTDYGVCDWCGEPFKDERDIYKVRGDYVCRTCVEDMFEERED